MKIAKKSRVRGAVNLGRWMSYAAAGAATAIAAPNDSEAGILFSGVLNSVVPNARNPVGGFNILQLHTMAANSNFGVGVVGTLSHVYVTAPGLPMGPNQFTYSNHFKQKVAPGTGAGRGVIGKTYNAGPQCYASKLAFGHSLSAGFIAATGGPRKNDMAHVKTRSGGVLSSVGVQAHNKWNAAGGVTAYLGFRFNSGGEHYGWAEITMSPQLGKPILKMTLVEYAYGTVGQVITAGETAVPEPASLGLLAIGAVGMLALRRGQKRNAAA